MAGGHPDISAEDRKEREPLYGEEHQREHVDRGGQPGREDDGSHDCGICREGAGESSVSARGVVVEEDVCEEQAEGQGPDGVGGRGPRERLEDRREAEDGADDEHCRDGDIAVRGSAAAGGIPEAVAGGSDRGRRPDQRRRAQQVGVDADERRDEDGDGGQVLRDDRRLAHQQPVVVCLHIDVALEALQERLVDPVVRVVLPHPQQLAPGLAARRARVQQRGVDDHVGETAVVAVE
ncbi:hypothetical protein NEOLI_003128 [Neolecta irregularis DAH-3]|uniref:Uncharacterized protein n=1 Tax=Neolecta irregularis (strain DAH-3) TaxID=1198029 RepID=A0A1U7LN57_NEOID|nr:hypothetical protein NEOLI_003128 [Neolecta irregularis DAH-3]|eukprot:OLL24084.1 hypothetical protein NEOLI_003128 [Neolecta irregularis DAH-3]